MAKATTPPLVEEAPTLVEEAPSATTWEVEGPTKDLPATPFDWRTAMKESVKRTMEVERPNTKFISIRGGQISYNNQAVLNNKLHCIIVGSVFENQFYSTDFDSNNPKNPDCFAISEDGAHMAPPEDWPTPEHETCDGCPRHEWRSDLKGGKGKACKEIRRLGLIPYTPDQEIDLQLADVLVVRLPVMSVNNWSKYVQTLGNRVQLAPWGVITELSTVPDPKSSFRVTFTCVAPVPEHMLEQLHAIHRFQEAEGLLMPYDPNPPAKEVTDKPKKY